MKKMIHTHVTNHLHILSVFMTQIYYFGKLGIVSI